MRGYFWAIIIVVLAVSWIISAEEEAKAPKLPKPTPVVGKVLSVDLEGRTVTVSEQVLQTTLVLNEKSTLTFKGPILDGIKAGDGVEAQVVDGEDGRKVAVKMTITREGVSPGVGHTTSKKKADQPPKK